MCLHLNHIKNIDNSCRTAIEVPPIPTDASNNELTKQSPIVVRRLEHILPGQNAFTANLPEDLQLNIKGARISQIYKRLDPDKPSYTVTGSGVAEHTSITGQSHEH